MNLDIIIPTLNEEDYIGPTIERIYSHAADINNISIWISDCASSDRTLEVAGKYSVNIPEYEIPPNSRARAMNFAADRSSGDVILFLHADSLVPMHFDNLIISTLSQKRVVGGAFCLRLDDEALVFRLIEVLNYLRFRILPRYFGDQGIFVNRSAFNKVGKYPDLHLMEDAQLCKRLWKIGRPGLIKEKIITSPRRFIEGGAWRVFFFDIKCTIRDWCNLSCEKYSEHYKKNNKKRGDGKALG